MIITLYIIYYNGKHIYREIIKDMFSMTLYNYQIHNYQCVLTIPVNINSYHMLVYPYQLWLV